MYIQATSADTKISNILSVLGTKPKLLDRAIDGPDLWSVIGSISDELSSKSNMGDYLLIKKDLQSLETDTMNLMVKTNAEMQSQA